MNKAERLYVLLGAYLDVKKNIGGLTGKRGGELKKIIDQQIESLIKEIQPIFQEKKEVIISTSVTKYNAVKEAIGEESGLTAEGKPWKPPSEKRGLFR